MLFPNPLALSYENFHTLLRFTNHPDSGRNGYSRQEFSALSTFILDNRTTGA